MPGAGPSGLFVGLATLDVIHLIDRLPGRDQKTVAQQTWLAAGGPATGAAIAFAALGGRARLWTALGEGAAAQAIRADLDTLAIEVIDAAPGGWQVAASTALLDAATGERSVISGSRQTTPLPDPILPDLTGTDVVLIDGHHPRLALLAATAAAGWRIPLVIDAGSHKPVFDQLLPLASDVICGADYAHPSGRTPASLLELGPRLLAVSHGAGDLRWWTPGAAGTIRPTPVPARDTLGAGDVLHGAYCHALAGGAEPRAALQQAVAVATERVRHLGPFRWRAALGQIGANGGVSA